MSKLSVRRHLYESMKNIYMKMITTTAMMISLLFAREVVEHKMGNIQSRVEAGKLIFWKLATEGGSVGKHGELRQLGAHRRHQCQWGPVATPVSVPATATHTSGFFKIQIHSEILKTMPKLLSAWYDDITNPSIHKLQELIFKRMRNICVKS